MVDFLSVDGAERQIPKRGFFPQAPLLARLCDVGAPTRLERGSTFCDERQESDHVAFLETGLCMAVKRLRNGSQQNVAIYVPGDILGHEAFALGTSTSTIMAITPATCHRLPIARVREVLARDANLAEAFWHYVAFQGALCQEWLLGLGRRPAFERTAHLLCELLCRMRAAGQASGTTCEFPLTQNELADVLGLSVVHVNRTLQKLRQTGYVSLSRGRLEISDWPRLTALAGFETAYLDVVAEG